MIGEDDSMGTASLDGPHLKRGCCSALDQHVIDSWTGLRVSVQPGITKVEVSCQYNPVIGSSQFFGERPSLFEFSTRDFRTFEVIRCVQIGHDSPAVHAHCLADAPFATGFADLTLA